MRPTNTRILRDSFPSVKLGGRASVFSLLLSTAAFQARGRMDEEREERRRQALRWNQGQYIVLGYHGPRWTDEELSLLATMTDDEVAERTGLTANAVRVKRGKLSREGP